MAFWWVNHKQTFKVETEEGYIWSPEKDNNGARNESYLNLTRVQPLDVVFSYAEGKISAIGIVEHKFLPYPRPEKFGTIGNQWSETGWLVPIDWKYLDNPIFPKTYLQTISPLLPNKYSPLQSNGDGNQKFYLTAISDQLGNLLISLINELNSTIVSSLSDIKQEMQEAQAEYFINQINISKTFKDQLIKARIGQGTFRIQVERIENGCRWTGLNDKQFLIASHIKPWKNSSNQEKLDGNNGLLLSPHVDKLFDKGYISFSETGRIMLASDRILKVLKYWELDPSKYVGAFTEKQQNYLEYHRSSIWATKRQELINF
jgi:putative restriction endonuclease